MIVTVLLVLSQTIGKNFQKKGQQINKRENDVRVFRRDSSTFGVKQMEIKCFNGKSFFFFYGFDILQYTYNKAATIPKSFSEIYLK